MLITKLASFEDAFPTTAQFCVEKSGSVLTAVTVALVALVMPEAPSRWCRRMRSPPLLAMHGSDRKCSQYSRIGNRRGGEIDLRAAE